MNLEELKANMQADLDQKLLELARMRNVVDRLTQQVHELRGGIIALSMVSFEGGVDEEAGTPLDSPLHQRGDDVRESELDHPQGPGGEGH